MGIVDEDVARVRDATDFVAVASQFAQLKRVGTRWVGLCPFHGEKTPSLSINADQKLFYCFGCQAKGDVITFVRDVEHLDFVGAVEWLAAKAGITIRYTESAQGEGRRERARLVEAMEAAVEWYHQRLLTAPDAGPARRYLRDRGFDGDIVRRYRLGWAPDEWDALARALRLPDAVGEPTGLVRVRRGRQVDFFRRRILFPIFDVQGAPVSFGGRVLPGGDPPKYLNTAETKLYTKSKVLYGLNWSKDEVVRADEVILCEGYTDVIGFASAGLPRAVAPCGTALTEDHVRLLRRFASKVVLAFDPDAAGRTAAERFYAWERAHEIEVRVADLPAGQDPGELARTDPEALRRAVVDAQPFLGFRIERVLAAADLSAPEGRARAAESAMALIAEHPSELVRDQYVMQVADRCRVDADRLRSGAAGRGGPSKPSHRTHPHRGGAAPAAPERRRSRPRESKEVLALRLAVDAVAGPAIVPLLHEVLFRDPLHGAALRALLESGGDLRAALDGADPEAAELLQRLAVEEPTGDPRDLRRALLRDAANRCCEELRREAVAAGDAQGYVPAITWLKAQIEAISPDARPSQAVEDQLLAWLADRAEEKG
ncbi:MAG: DNA primase [Actinobacteria bacterium]|nr:DNA primase [Actinomycetota bacterium]